MPVVVGFVVIGIDGDGELGLVQFEDLGEEFPGPGNGFFFEIVAEGEVPQHFKERMMTSCAAYVVDVICTDAFLAGRHAVRWRYKFACKIGFERGHAGADEQETWVVFRNERKAVQDEMLFAFKEFQIGCADFITRHILHDIKHSLLLASLRQIIRLFAWSEQPFWQFCANSYYIV